MMSAVLWAKVWFGWRIRERERELVGALDCMAASLELEREREQAAALPQLNNRVLGKHLRQ